jgi:oxygen-independent coproporphyrinogen-3 oxidase
VVPAAELPFEFMLNALRLVEGFTLAEFEHATGLPAAAVQGTIAAQAARGTIAESNGRYRATALGFRFLNDLISAFLPGEKALGAAGELYTAPSRFVPDRDFRRFVSEMR